MSFEHSKDGFPLLVAREGDLVALEGETAAWLVKQSPGTRRTRSALGALGVLGAVAGKSLFLEVLGKMFEISSGVPGYSFSHF